MGLDVDVYWGLTKVESPQLDEEGYPENNKERKFYDNTDFPGRIEGIDPDAVYQYKGDDEVFSGGYGRYNRWREDLAKMAGYPAVAVERYGVTEYRHDEGAWKAGAGPFFELISFSDCEGTIGPVVAAKLAKDFAEFQPKAEARDDYFREAYAGWRKGCEMASDSGALNFY